ncbi:hypothetical protein L1987_05896 [Smallanthus sonchifolius]|uniref:Uncharacterized protein n=1 Tax=Smallanthus sonchifolius TaxID=185202 RepID=A0ACB9JWR3_9ASTR|nr:hypothetical protein L1987_05896 [Smallanthus sonchifolius]
MEDDGEGSFPVFVCGGREAVGKDATPRDDYEKRRTMVRVAFWSFFAMVMRLPEKTIVRNGGRCFLEFVSGGREATGKRRWLETKDDGVGCFPEFVCGGREAARKDDGEKQRTMVRVAFRSLFAVVVRLPEKAMQKGIIEASR